MSLFDYIQCYMIDEVTAHLIGRTHKVVDTITNLNRQNPFGLLHYALIRGKLSQGKAKLYIKGKSVYIVYL